MTRVFIPLDSFAVACGADEIAEELALAAARGGHDVAMTWSDRHVDATLTAGGDRLTVRTPPGFEAVG